jgi:hypothetical protein
VTTAPACCSSSWRGSTAASDAKQAHAWYLDLLEGRPAPAESAYAELLRRGGEEPGDALRLARYEMRSGRGATARTRLQTALAPARPATERAEMQLAIAESYLRSGDARRCLDTVEHAAPVARGTRFEPERLRFKRGPSAGSASATRRWRLPRAGAALPGASDCRRRALRGRLAARERAASCALPNKPTTAARRPYPKGSLADDTDLRAGLCALRAQRPGDAAAHFAELVTQHPKSKLVDNALYWQDAVAGGLGDPSGALVLARPAGARLPALVLHGAGAPAHRARLVVAASPPAEAAPATGAWPPDSGIRARRARSRRLRGPRSRRCAKRGSRRPPTSSRRRACWRFLRDAGLGTEARWETRRLEKLYETDAGALLELMALNHARGRTSAWCVSRIVLGQRVTDPG